MAAENPTELKIIRENFDGYKNAFELFVLKLTDNDVRNQNFENFRDEKKRAVEKLQKALSYEKSQLDTVQTVAELERSRGLAELNWSVTNLAIALDKADVGAEVPQEVAGSNHVVHLNSQEYFAVMLQNVLIPGTKIYAQEELAKQFTRKIEKNQSPSTTPSLSGEVAGQVGSRFSAAWGKYKFGDISRNLGGRLGIIDAPKIESQDNQYQLFDFSYAIFGGLFDGAKEYYFPSHEQEKHGIYAVQYLLTISAAMATVGNPLYGVATVVANEVQKEIFSMSQEKAFGLIKEAVDGDFRKSFREFLENVVQSEKDNETKLATIKALKDATTAKVAKIKLRPDIESVEERKVWGDLIWFLGALENWVESDLDKNIKTTIESAHSVYPGIVLDSEAATRSNLYSILVMNVTKPGSMLYAGEALEKHIVDSTAKQQVTIVDQAKREESNSWLGNIYHNLPTMQEYKPGMLTGAVVSGTYSYLHPKDELSLTRAAAAVVNVHEFASTYKENGFAGLVAHYGTKLLIGEAEHNLTGKNVKKPPSPKSTP